MSKRPNLVLTIADDQRYDAVGCWSSSALDAAGRIAHPRTPALDRLAARGTHWRSVYIPGSTHGAVCAPSRAQLHTGRTLYHVADDLRGPRGAPCDSLPTLGQRLGEAGYTTFATGKWHNEAAGLLRSFQHARRIMSGGMSAHFCMRLADRQADGTLGKASLVAGHSTELFVEATLDFIRAQARNDQPFFLYCAFTAPHDPRETFWRWHAMYPWDRMADVPSFVPEHPFDNGSLRGRDEKQGEFPRTHDEARFHTSNYFAMVSHMDDAIGRIHAALAEAGLLDNTIVAHTADHGLALGRHGLMGKQNLYDHSIRVPLIMAGPGIEAGAVRTGLCYMQDLHPTLLSAAGVDADSEFRDLFDSPRESVGAAYALNQRMIRSGDWKLIEYRVGAERRRQVFNLADDPLEVHDLSGDNARADSLRGELSRWCQWMDDPQAGVFR